MSEEFGKGLRSSELNLRVVVGPEEGGQTARKQYHYHAVALATHSTFIDTMIATPMKEGEEYIIHFPDLAPEKWETMMKFLCPSEALIMSTSDAALLAVEYDKYDFSEGRKCCDTVLAELFAKSLTAGFPKIPDDLDAMVDSFVLANEAHLPTTKDLGKEYFAKTLADVTGRTMFTESMLNKLAPFVVDNKLLREGSSGWNAASALIPTFAKDFSENGMVSAYAHALEKAASFIVVSGSGSAFDGEYSRTSRNTFVLHTRSFFRKKYNSFSVAKEEDSWVVRALHTPSNPRWGIIVWKRRYSSNWVVVPPENGWELQLQEHRNEFRSDINVSYS